MQTHGVAGLGRAQHPHGPPRLARDAPRRRSTTAGAAVRERAAVVELEGIRHLGAPEHLLERDLLLELGLDCSAPWRWFFTATCAICSSVVPYLAMWARAIRAKTPGKVSPAGCSNERVRGVGEDLGGALGGHGQDALGAADQQHRPPRPRRSRTARGGTPRGSSAHAVSNRVAATSGMPSAEVTCGTEVELPLSGLADDVPDVHALHLARADPRVGEGVEPGLREQLRAGALVLAELRHPDADHRDSSHGLDCIRRCAAPKACVGCAVWRRPYRRASGPSIRPLRARDRLGADRARHRGVRPLRHLHAPSGPEARRRGADRVREPRPGARRRRTAGGSAGSRRSPPTKPPPPIRASTPLIVCTPHHLHEAHARLAAEHAQGLLEKPIARTLPECRCRHLGGARYRRRRAHGGRERPLRARLRGGARVRAGGGDRRAPSDRPERAWLPAAGWMAERRAEMGGGLLIDGGIHYLHLLRDWAGPVDDVVALAPREHVPRREGEDTVFVMLRFRAALSRRWPTSIAAPRLPRWQWAWLHRHRRGLSGVDYRGRALWLSRAIRHPGACVRARPARTGGPAGRVRGGGCARAATGAASGVRPRGPGAGPGRLPVARHRRSRGAGGVGLRKEDEVSCRSARTARRSATTGTTGSGWRST